MQSKGLLESSPALQFESIKSSVLTLLYGPPLTSIYTGKTIALTILRHVEDILCLAHRRHGLVQHQLPALRRAQVLVKSACSWHRGWSALCAHGPPWDGDKIQILVRQARGGTGVLRSLPTLKQRGAVRVLGLSLLLALPALGAAGFRGQGT